MFTIAFYLALVTFFVSKNRKRILGYTSICLTGIGLFCEIFMGFPFVSFLYILNPINWILYGLLPIRGSILVIFQSIIQIVIALIAIKDPEKAKTEKQKNVISDNPNRENSESYFDGGLSQLIGWSILGFLITVITLGICYPWSFTMLYSWETKHTVIEGKRLKFDGTAAQLFGNWIKWFLLTIVTLGIYGFWIPIKLKKWKTKHTSFE